MGVSNPGDERRLHALRWRLQNLTSTQIPLMTAVFLSQFAEVHMSHRNSMRDEDLAQKQYSINAPKGYRLMVEA
ncbi:cytochrome P450 [Aspergillus luchuensis]|uniref:Cytochrome P450 n=1 Tax=Aspergillus kawachii TaxID=1069201 RepID=A0A146F3P2_ASPKA|nr:cytochrome P450 [Aspergillus luchuensis]